MAASPMNALLMTPRILWGALYFSTFLYLYVLLTAAPEPAVPPEPVMLYVLAVVALGTAVISFVLPNVLHRKAAQMAKLEVEEIPDPDASVMFRDQTPTIRVFADPKEVRKKAMALYFTPLILALALTEAVAIYGLVLGFMGFALPMVLPFFAVAWVLFLPRFPRASAAIGPLERAHGARLLDA